MLIQTFRLCWIALECLYSDERTSVTVLIPLFAFSLTTHTFPIRVYQHFRLFTASYQLKSRGKRRGSIRRVFRQLPFLVTSPHISPPFISLLEIISAGWFCGGPGANSLSDPPDGIEAVLHLYSVEDAS